MRYVVDTNVPIVANGPSEDSSLAGPTFACRLSCVEFLMELLKDHQILLDESGLIQAEYRNHLNSRGQPGVGDRFYLEVINSHPERVARLPLPVGLDGQFQDLPVEILQSTFDPSDRKFAALAKQTNESVVNATDSDWRNHKDLLERNGIRILFLCDCP